MAHTNVFIHNDRSKQSPGMTHRSRLPPSAPASHGTRTSLCIVPGLCNNGQDVQLSRSTGCARATVPAIYMNTRVPLEDGMSGAAIPCGASLPRLPALRDVPASLAAHRSRASLRSAMYLHPLWRIAPAPPCALRCTCIPAGKKKPAHRTGMLFWWTVQESNLQSMD